MNSWLQKQWTSYTLWHLLLIPLSWIFGAIVYARASLYRIGWLKSVRLSVPVIVVGNINVGGTGKTPLVIWLAEQLQREGFKPGIISRGYGGRVEQVTEVFANSNPAEVGDEPVLIVKRTGCTMFVGADRVAAGQALLQAHPQCDVIVSDDGLQHYRLQRDMEIALINTNSLQTGNLCLLPAGPLREKITRLESVDAIIDSGNAIVSNGYFKEALQSTVFNMFLQGDMFEPVDGRKIRQPASYFTDKSLVAIAGIGNPERFFNQLAMLGLQFEEKTYLDHYAYSAQDLAKFSNQTLLMTEKDAVKCRKFTTNDAWYLPVTATINNSAQTSLIALVLKKLKSKIN
ncbi:MAG: tetraacyldisaccharide 4'-kinase [Methylotenera sp.]|nr:tetraacyldisaccharide 4'-kinase [Methylotenera sp.]